jgi:drug/metabolite transporter (DMT)-like permease
VAPFLISLASAASWGISDFLGGQQTRRLPVLAVLAVSQPAGLVLIALLIALTGADPISAGKLAIACLAGAASLGGLAAFYSAMAMGTVSVVAPIAALGVVVPVVIGLAQGESPGAIQLAGLVPAIAGVVVLSYEERPEQAESPRAARLSIVLAIVAGLGFGIFFTGLDAAAADRPGWAILAVRVGGVATVLVALLATRPRFDGVAAAWPVLIVIGTFDVLANALFAIASTKGALPVVAVGGSMYPAFTVALAHTVLGERLATLQWSGVVLALGGVGMIAAGS